MGLTEAEVRVRIAELRRTTFAIITQSILFSSAVTVFAVCNASYYSGVANVGWIDPNTGIRHVKWSYPSNSTADMNQRIDDAMGLWNAKTSTTNIVFDRVDSGYTDLSFDFDDSGLQGVCGGFDDSSRTIHIDPRMRTAASSSYYSQVTGSVAHEVGHALDLDHDGNGVMRVASYSDCTPDVMFTSP